MTTDRDQSAAAPEALTAALRAAYDHGWTDAIAMANTIARAAVEASGQTHAANAMVLMASLLEIKRPGATNDAP